MSSGLNIVDDQVWVEYISKGFLNHSDRFRE